jgi:hypothetical protein
MQRIYFVVDRQDELCRVETEAVEALWEGRGGTTALGCDPGETLRLISVLLDEDLNPQVVFFLRLDLDRGEITPESRLEAYDAVTARGAKFSSPAAQKQFVGWPADWPRQLAVATDTPVAALNRIALGGPLLMSDLWGVPVEKVVEYFEGVNFEELS